MQTVYRATLIYLLSNVFYFLECSNTRNVSQRMTFYCRTPNSEKGYCLPISNCTLLAEQLKNKNARKFIKESSCGSKNENKSNPFVCCGTHSNYFYLEAELPEDCGRKNINLNGRILGGKPAKINEFPWMARLYHKKKSGVKTFGCTGFLISSRFVLTAGHCLKSENVKNMGPIKEVQLGEYNTNTYIDCVNNTCADKIQKIQVKKTIPYPSYDENSINHHHDIGLIFLKKEVKITKFVSPVCINGEFPNQGKNSTYTLAGWGETETASYSSEKLKVSVPFFPYDECAKKFEKLGLIVTHKQICAGGEKNKDSCSGDSGGPLMLPNEKNRWFAVGIVSYGRNCGEKGWPAIYTNVSSYMKWIKTQFVKLTTRKKSKVFN